jgi:hypothetical protein
VALDQLEFTVPRFDPYNYNTIAVRKVTGSPGHPIGQNTAVRGDRRRQGSADGLLRPYVEQTALKPIA